MELGLLPLFTHQVILIYLVEMEKNLIILIILKNEINKFIDLSSLKKALVLDGEIVSKNFQELMKQIHRKSSSQNEDASLFLFDILPLQDFQEGIYKSNLKERIIYLKKFYNENFKNCEKYI